MWRYYLVPALVVGSRRQPNYVKGPILPTGLSVPWGGMPWGKDDRFLLGAEVSAAEHLVLAASAGVTALPIDDSGALSTADQAAVRAFADALGLPSSWITGTETGKNLARSFAGVALVLQRFNGRARFPLTDKLTATVRSLTTEQRDHLLEVANDLGLSRAGIDANSTIGDLVISWGRQFSTQQVFVGGRTL
jgi:hypothetical protein